MKYRFLLCMCCCVLAAALRAQGLLFDRIQKPIKERTSYVVFNEGEEPSFRERFRLSFELSIRDFNNFGYIFFLRNQSEHTAYSFTYIYLNEHQSMLKFNTDGKQNHYTIVLDNDSLENRWLPVAFDFDLKNDCLSIAVAGEVRKVDQLGFTSPFIPFLCFGRYDYILDSPSFAIRNLCVEGGRKQFHFPLKESKGEAVHEEGGREMGHVEHPYWLINSYYNWELLYEARTSTPSGIAYDESRQELLLFCQDSLFTYHLEQRRVQLRPYATPLPVRLQLGTHFFSQADHRLYVYELNNLPLGDVTVAAMDTALRWQAVGTASLPVQLHHHVGFYNEQEERYYVFGGFGNKRYNNAFLAYTPKTDSWDTLRLQGDAIAPRYFSGMAVTPDRRMLYLFGGMGNESGEQSVGRNYYNDLWKADLGRRTLTRVWDGGFDIRRVQARNMVLSADGTRLYMLSYPEYLSETYLQLYRLPVTGGQPEAVGDSIPMISDEITSNANLYYNKVRDEFYCTVQEFTKQGEVHTRIYSLQAPPVSAAEMDAYASQYVRGWGWMGDIWLAGGVLLLVGVAWMGRKLYFRRSAAPVPVPVSAETVVASAETVAATGTDATEVAAVAEEPLPSEASEPAAPAANAIFLFGPFTVLNRNGMDISHLFSARIRQLFIYILLHSDRQGVLSTALNDIIWPDKSDDKVKNVKGVTINQLRKILSDLDGIDLNYEKGYFCLRLQQPCYCDYFHFSGLTVRGDATDGDALLSLLLRGRFLEGISFAPFDGFKLRVEEYLASWLPLEMERQSRLHQVERVVRLCDVQLSIDPLNEKAISFLVGTLHHAGRSQEAILRYSAFVKNYRQLLGTDCPLSYRELLDREFSSEK